ncbi:MAG TPA: DegQ family serine endoprotease [Rhodocyclaceae bacterium]
MKSLSRKISALTLALTVVAAFAISHSSAATAQTRATAPAETRMPTAGAARGLPNFADIVERYGPSVVHIRVEGQAGNRTPAANPFGNLDPNDPFFQFFRRFGPPMQPPGGNQRPVRGLGSGFIVSADGLILTNAHVVADAAEITVRLSDKRELQAKLVGLDKLTDIALLRIPAKGLPTIPIGDPAKARVGDWVLAIGSPFGFDNSVTAGIVSAKSRSLPDENYVPFIQTDVAINPGNSGGPLLNLDGEVIGINSQIYSRSGGYQGLSFAIPIDVAEQIKTQLLATGKVTRGRLGISIQGLNQGLAKSFGLDSVQGALVSQVEPDSPAAKAGVQVGDVILEFNGDTVDDSSSLPPMVGSVKPGTKVKLKVWRERKEKTLTVTVGEMPNQSVAAADSPDGAQLGVAVRPLAKNEAANAQLEGGLLVLKVTGAAAQAGIEVGDIILAVNGAAMETVDDLRASLKGVGRHAAVLVQRGESRIFIPVDLG